MSDSEERVTRSTSREVRSQGSSSSSAATISTPVIVSTPTIRPAYLEWTSEEELEAYIVSRIKESTSARSNASLRRSESAFDTPIINRMESVQTPMESTPIELNPDVQSLIQNIPASPVQVIHNEQIDERHYRNNTLDLINVITANKISASSTEVKRKIAAIHNAMLWTARIY